VAPTIAFVPTRNEPLADLLRAVLVRVEDLVAAEERVRSLLEAVSVVAGDLDLHATLARIVTAAARLADAQYAALGVIDTSGEGLVDFITYGMSAPTVASIGGLPRGHGILGLLIDEPQPLRLHDLNTHPSSYGFPAHHPPMQSFLGVPVRVGDRVFGNLYLPTRPAATTSPVRTSSQSSHWRRQLASPSRMPGCSSDCVAESAGSRPRLRFKTCCWATSIEAVPSL